MARSLGGLTVFFVWTVHLVGVSYSAVYTATRKVQDMVEQEEGTLNSLYAAISNHGNGTATECFLKFYHSRILRVKERQQGLQMEEYLKHPNSIYQVIKEFATEYEHLRAALGSSPPDVQNHLSSMADLSDIAGARLSVLRLQTVYSLNASDMIRGDYFGYMGPELSDVDAFEIGKTAFNEEKFGFAINWLDEALSRAKVREPSFSFYNPDDVDNNRGRIYALLGRSYLRLGNGAKATEMYELARSSDPTTTDVAELRAELANPPEVKPPQDEDADFKRLCTLQNQLTKSKFDRRLVCSYKQAILPYYRFKMELVSVSPYVALFYEVISDSEGQTIMNAARGNLKRGRVESDAGNSIVKESRTSDLSFVPDSDSPIIAGLSKRVAAVTNLVTKPYVEGGDFCAEPFQVVNYGMGGHYAMHFDTFHETSLRTQSNQMYNVYGGNRLATFLIYLTSVERGGATVFPRANLAVAPIKNMALFWYSSNPAGVRHEKTIHAGCPVIYGYKWVSNKWIWLHGNVFSRRCGLRPLTTQMGIDQHMRREWA